MVQKKSFQQSLEDIKEKMKEKRNRRLSAAAAARRSVQHRGAAAVKPLVLKSVQANNKALAVALQAEREKVRQAQGVILQLKKERQTLLFHLLMLKRTLRERPAHTTPQEVSPPEETSPPRPAQPISPRPVDVCDDVQQLPSAESRLSADARSVSLPPTVGMRRKRCSGMKRRRSSRFYSNPEQTEERGAQPSVEDLHQHQQAEEARVQPVELDVQLCTPEAPARKKRSAQPKAERGRKADRAPLKKPWENHRSRARSKSRERPQSRAGATLTPADRLNSSLGGNDTFDFDCEEAVHLTPFRDKHKHTEMEPEPLAAAADVMENISPMEGQEEDEEEEETPYIPNRRIRRACSPVARRARSKRRSNNMQTHSTGKTSSPMEEEEEEEELEEEEETPYIPNRRIRRACSPAARRARSKRRSNNMQTHSTEICSAAAVMEEQNTADLLFTSPICDAEEKRRTSDLQSGPPQLSSSPAESLVSMMSPAEPELLLLQSPVFEFQQNQENQQPQPACRRTGGLVLRSFLGLALSDVSNVVCPAARQTSSSAGHTPQSCRRQRRAASAVNYKEPSINTKLRRGDKFTDTRFLRSPIFKQKSSSSRRSSLKKMEIYNEAFVGCR